MSKIMMLSAAALLFSSASAQNQPYKGQHITVLLEGHPTSDAIKAMLPEFTQATGIDVDAEIVPYNDLTSKALLEFSSQSGRYDVVMDDWVHGVGYASAGYIEPISSYAKRLGTYYQASDFVPKYLNTMTYKSGQYGLPVYGESTFLMYRKDLFAQYKIKVPTTFAELELAAKTIHDRTNGRIAGITLRGEQGIQNVYVWSGFLWGFGGQWLNDGKSALGTPEAAKALTYYSNLLRQYGPKGVANFGWQENRQLFQQGRAAMTIDATVNGAFNEDPKESSVVGKVGYAPVPTQPGVNAKGGNSSLTVHGFYLSKASKAKDAAWLFMSWATAKEQQIKSLQTNPNSGVSSRGAMNSSVFIRKYGAFREAMLKAIDRGNINYLPTIPQANDVINNTGVAISRVLAGTSTAAPALKQANDLNDKALSK